MTPSTKHGDNESSKGQVSELQVVELKRLVLAEKAKWRDKHLALLANEKSKKKFVLRPILEGDDEEL